MHKGGVQTAPEELTAVEQENILVSSQDTIFSYQVQREQQLQSTLKEKAELEIQAGLFEEKISNVHFYYFGALMCFLA